MFVRRAVMEGYGMLPCAPGVPYYLGMTTSPKGKNSLLPLLVVHLVIVFPVDIIVVWFVVWY